MFSGYLFPAHIRSVVVSMAAPHDVCSRTYNWSVNINRLFSKQDVMPLGGGGTKTTGYPGVGVKRSSLSVKLGLLTQGATFREMASLGGGQSNMECIHV